MGDIAPRILEARLFDLGNRDMAFDLEMKWKVSPRQFDCVFRVFWKHFDLMFI